MDFKEMSIKSFKTKLYFNLHKNFKKLVSDSVKEITNDNYFEETDLIHDRISLKLRDNKKINKCLYYLEKAVMNELGDELIFEINNAYKKTKNRENNTELIMYDADDRNSINKIKRFFLGEKDE